MLESLRRQEKEGNTQTINNSSKVLKGKEAKLEHNRNSNAFLAFPNPKSMKKMYKRNNCKIFFKKRKSTRNVTKN